MKEKETDAIERQADKEEEALLELRFSLASERIRALAKDTELETAEKFRPFFQASAEFLIKLLAQWEWQETNTAMETPIKELREKNRTLYADILPEQYESCYGNPAYTASLYGEEMGQLLSFLYAELHSQIAAVYERKKLELTLRLELFLLFYQEFVQAWQEHQGTPSLMQLKGVLCSFVNDYMPQEVMTRVREQLDPSADFLVRIIMEADLQDVRYLYAYGEYITENEETLAGYLAALPGETIARMADTFTEGYRIGFAANGKDLSRKKTVNIRYQAGFERVIRAAVLNFEKMGLKPVIYRASTSIFHRRGAQMIGFYGALANQQFLYDHKEDNALYLDRKFVSRRLEALQNAYEACRELAAVHGGPACMEAFGEKPFAPMARPQALRLNTAQQKLSVEYASGAGELVNRYIPGEERSFTIIAFPVPEIGSRFGEIFDAVIDINTLDYKRYQRMQQILIDILDKAQYVQIKGSGLNHTDMKVMLHPLKNPEKETIFENCVADVNIPVGEVFTSPQLEGTHGVLHVTRVFLNGLLYRDLELKFEDGRVAAYRCKNFPTEEEGRHYIRENVLFHHESLPIGEFAIGTNTTAYAAAKKYDIADKLPILIAEKTGPHFAVGDTCYSHSEELAVYNPDGKEIIARDNSQSLKRLDKDKDAYYNCHTDITIPYDELGEITAVAADGTEYPIFADGGFVPKGCEELNLALKMY